MKSHLARKCLLAVWMMGVAAAAILQYTPPAALPADADLSRFSAGRAAVSLACLSQTPRAPGTPEHAAARDWLAGQMTTLGYEVQFQDFSLPEGLQGTNVLARLQGTGAGKSTLLLMAHYDTLPGGYGASDDASGIAVLLELARLLKREAEPENDIIFLFTDAEELGVLGAEAFSREHPWAGSVEAALNFDTFARGPAFLWNTGAFNGGLVILFQEYSPLPQGMAWVDRMARLLPMDTDISPFLRRGISGGNFTAPFLPFEDHTPEDKYSTVDLRSLQSAGEQGWALLRGLGHRDLTALKEADRLYFNPVAFWMISYDAGCAQVWGAAALLALSGMLWLIWRREKIRPGKLIRVGLINGVLLMAMMVMAAVIWLTGYLQGGSLFPEDALLGISILILLALYVWIYSRFICKGAGIQERLAWGISLWGILAVTTCWCDFFLSQPLTLAFLLSCLAAAGLYLPMPQPWKGLTITAGLSGAIFLWTPVVYDLFSIAGQVVLPAALGAGALAMGMMLGLPVMEKIAVMDRS